MGSTAPDENSGSGGRALENRDTILRIAGWNIGSLTGRAGELVETFNRRKVDIGCVQETRWKGASARWFGEKGSRYKLYWQGCKEGTAGVGVFVAKKWVEYVIKVDRVSERIIMLKLAVGRRVINVISVYGPQAGRSVEEKEIFWDKVVDLVKCCAK